MSRNRNRKGGGVKRVRHEDWMADIRDTSTLYNKQFELYYRGNVVPESEWVVFMQTMQSSLPLALRVNRAHARSAQIGALVKDSLSHVFDTRVLPFYPDAAAMQCQASRADLKRNAELKSLKRLIAALNEGGFLTRQEAVSMLPPLLLQPKPGMRILDLCAAPGSKTSQLLEALLPVPESGVVVANDLNASRLDVLHHQTNRLAGAHAHLILTNYDATHFPLLPPDERFDCVLCDVMCSGDGTLRKSIDMWPRWSSVNGADLHRTQCAVLMRGMASCRAGGLLVYSTCSLNPVENEAVVSECLSRVNGVAGTGGAEPSASESAEAMNNGNEHAAGDVGEHDGGVDSTSATSPASSVCRFRLLDAQAMLPGLMSSPGMTAWTITTKDGSTRLSTFADAQAYHNSYNCSEKNSATFTRGEEVSTKDENDQVERKAPPPRRSSAGFRYLESMFAQPAQLQAQQIHYTRRILPHQQDTGGFYIAIMQCERALDATCTHHPSGSSKKSSNIPSSHSFPGYRRGGAQTVEGAARRLNGESAAQVVVTDDAAPAATCIVSAGPTDTARPLPFSVSLSPFKPLSTQLRQTVQRALGLPSYFPYANLLVRNEQAREQKIYYANNDTAELSHRLGSRVVHVGAKVMESFVKCSNEKLRLCADGVSCVAPLLCHTDDARHDDASGSACAAQEQNSETRRQNEPRTEEEEKPSTASMGQDDTPLFASAPFLVPVSPELLLRAAQHQPHSLSYDEFTRMTNYRRDALPYPSCILHCTHPSLGSMYVAAEQSSKHGVMMIPVAEWQLTLCRHALQMPLVANTMAESADVTEDAADDACLS